MTSQKGLKQAITDFIAYYNQQAKPIQWTYTIDKLEKKLEQRRKQETEHQPEQKSEQNIKTKLKQKKERNSKGKLKQKLGQKRENPLREKKSLKLEIRADQNSDRISA